MIGSVAKMVAYSKAPRTTFTVLHPRKALKLRAMKQEVRHSPVPRIAAIGAAAIALPLGLALGRLTRRPSDNGH
jgi:hypothetical protein